MALRGGASGWLRHRCGRRRVPGQFRHGLRCSGGTVAQAAVCDLGKRWRGDAGWPSGCVNRREIGQKPRRSPGDCGCVKRVAYRLTCRLRRGGRLGGGWARRVGTGGGGRPCERFVLDAGDFCWRLSGARAVWQVRDGGGGLFALVGRDRRLECAASRRRGTGGGGFLANFPTVYAVLGARRRKRPFATWGNAGAGTPDGLQVA